MLTTDTQTQARLAGLVRYKQVVLGLVTEHLTQLAHAISMLVQVLLPSGHTADWSFKGFSKSVNPG